MMTFEVEEIPEYVIVNTPDVGTLTVSPVVGKKLLATNAPAEVTFPYALGTAPVCSARTR
jgi:hypothetical protein